LEGSLPAFSIGNTAGKELEFHFGTFVADAIDEFNSDSLGAAWLYRAVHVVPLVEAKAICPHCFGE